MTPKITLAALAVVVGCSVPATRYLEPSGDGPATTPTLDVSMASYEFGTVVISTATAPATFVFSNPREATTPPLLPAALSGPSAVLFMLGADRCAGRTLATGERCAVEVMMAPSSEGAAAATLTVATAQGGGATVALAGKAVAPGALRLAPTTNTFASLAPGAVSTDATFTATNTGGSPTGTITVTLSGTDAAQFAIASDSCTGKTLAPAGACTIKARFAPRAAGGMTASLTASSVAAGTGVAALGGHAFLPAALAMTPPTSDFGAVVTGGISATTTFTVSNTGELASGALATTLSGADAGQFQVASDSCAGRSLAPAATCAITVVFAPSAAAPRVAQLTVTGAPGGAVSSAVQGTGIPPAALVFVPTSNNYGTVDVGATASATFMLSNTGGQASSAITTGLAGTNASELAITSDGCAAQVLAAGASCMIVVAVAPTTFGAKSATLQASAGVGGVTAASLSATGRDKVALTVSTTGGNGTGTVTCNGGACAAQYYRGTQVTLAAVPDASMKFAAWSGACAGTATTCTLTLIANTTVTAGFVPLNQDLTLATTGVAGATGAITTSPAGTPCGAGCLRFPTGTVVTLTAAPNAGSYLRAWSGDCVGNGLTCQLTLSAPRSATAALSPANLVFVTSGRFVPNPVNTIQWADATCQSAAQAAGLAGTYIGWIGAGSATWEARLGNASGWVRTDGKPFATTRAELVAGHSLYPNLVDERRVALPATTLVLSGTSGYDCMGWTQGAGSGGRQMPGLAAGGWQQAAVYDWYDYDAFAPGSQCGTALPLMCLGVDYNVNLTYGKAAGRLAFIAVSRLAGTPNGNGVAGLDQFCADKATAAGLPGSYRALVATKAASAATRFSVAGAPWVRTDGVPIVAQASDLFRAPAPTMIAALDVDETGAAAYAAPLAGAVDLVSAGTVSSTCNDYTDATLQTFGLVGSDTFVNPAMFGYAQNQCYYGSSVYCLQQ